MKEYSFRPANLQPKAKSTNIQYTSTTSCQYLISAYIGHQLYTIYIQAEACDFDFSLRLGPNIDETDFELWWCFLQSKPPVFRKAVFMNANTNTMYTHKAFMFCLCNMV